MTLNGQTVSGREGMTVLQLAQEIGIHIPTLCHHPSLMPAGACRVCLVEDEKTGALLASCVTPILPGMAIRTDSPRVLEARRMIVQLLLASHPESCLLCDKGNRCQLRQIAAELGVGLSELYKLPHYTGIQEVNPFIQRDLSKCILCGKCIRADHELVVQGAIDYFHRGFNAKPATLQDQPLEKSECTFCGTCVTLCPTGALSVRGKASPSTVTRRVSSVCPYCACGCAVLLGVNGQRVTEVSPDGRKASVNYPTLCVKGSHGWEFIHSPDRLTTPMIRQEGKLQECSWEEALHCVVEELGKIQAQKGPEFLAFLGSSKCTNEENYLFQRLARAAVGTPHIDHGSPLNSLPSPRFFGAEWGWGAMTGKLSGIEESPRILVLGANPEETAPIVSYKIKRAVRYRGAQLILVDPRKTKLSSFARLWLRPKLGKDTALILGFIRSVLDEDLGEREPGRKEREALAQKMQPFTLQWAEEESGISQAFIRSAARDFTSAKPTAIIFGNGLWQNGQDISRLHALMILARLLGSQALFYPLGKESNGQGARDMGTLPDFLPGYQSLLNEGERIKFERAWRKTLPRQIGMTGLQMIAGAQRGKIRGMYIMGENPVRSFPDGTFVREALETLEFLVVQDLFLTETAQLATVVLPGCSFAEKEGTLTSAERRVQLLHPASDPVGQSQPDWKIVAEISRRMGLEKNYDSTGQILDEIHDLVPLYQGITKAQLEKGDSHWPCTPGGDPGEPFHPIGAPAREKRKMAAPKAEMGRGTEREGFPFQLILGSALWHGGSGTRSSKAPRLLRFSNQSILRMNPRDASQWGVEEGGLVKVAASGRELACFVTLDSGLPPGVLFLPVSPDPGRVLDLLKFPTDVEGDFPLSKTIAVQIERI